MLQVTCQPLLKSWPMLHVQLSLREVTGIMHVHVHVLYACVHMLCACAVCMCCVHVLCACAVCICCLQLMRIVQPIEHRKQIAESCKQIAESCKGIQYK